jgi:hypothetical protein
VGGFRTGAHLQQKVVEQRYLSARDPNVLRFGPDPTVEASAGPLLHYESVSRTWDSGRQSDLAWSRSTSMQI